MTDSNGDTITAIDVITNFDGEAIFDTGVQIECRTDEFVSANCCQTCPPGTTNEQGDVTSGPDTQCDITYCAVNEYVSAHNCLACPPGTVNESGDDASGADTECDVVEEIQFEDGFEVHFGPA